MQGISFYLSTEKGNSSMGKSIRYDTKVSLTFSPVLLSLKQVSSLTYRKPMIKYTYRMRNNNGFQIILLTFFFL